jgi:hypothetical protein
VLYGAGAMAGYDRNRDLPDHKKAHLRGGLLRGLSASSGHPLITADDWDAVQFQTYENSNRVSVVSQNLTFMIPYL